ncbi:hypothetical protein BX070DRAFT_251817 [Coemansia spiralis]|nr:hypothetical protein BX070DRAFT_251817 [Coemansia spiralis]
MPKTAASRLPSRPVTAASDLSSCGGLVDGLPNSFTSSGLGLGHSDILSRKRSLDNMENVPPSFGMDSPSALSVSVANSKPAVSLLDLAAQQLSQSQRKHRRTVITASSPGGHQRMSANPRRMARLSDSSFMHGLSLPHPGSSENNTPSKLAVAATPQSTQSHKKLRPQLPLQPHTSTSFSSNSNSSSEGARLRRLPKRNLKPLDFPTFIAQEWHLHILSCILSLPVSPTSSSSTSSGPFVSLDPAAVSSPATEMFPHVIIPKDSLGSIHPTPPSTQSRAQPAFSGLLASAYQRASAKRSSRRDDSLLECDPVLGPRCPVIGHPRGLFDLHKNGIDHLRREQTERTESKFSEMARTVRQAQAAFEAAVGEQVTKGRPAGKKANRQSTPIASASTSKRPISQCKYCGKQYKYHSKLASHEQHCSSRLEALLYSADESEQHIIHCVCGPRHDYPAGERDELPMVQCDNCLLWLHIDCVGIDENNLPEEYFCVRCSEAFDDKRGKGHVLGVQLTPRRKSKLGGGPGMMSPESHRLATLLARVPSNDGSETEEEPMNLKAKGRGRRGRPSRKSKAAAANSDGMGSEDTMSISDVAEVTRFHRQGSTQRRSKSPIAPRMAQSEADAPPAFSPTRRRRVRASANGTQQTVHTDVLSSDFLGLPLPESIFSEKPPRFGAGIGPTISNTSVAPSSISIVPGLCSQQPSMEDLTRIFSGSQPEWSLAQLNMLNCTTAGGASRSNDMIGGSSFSLDLALADLGLGLGAAANGGITSGLSLALDSGLQAANANAPSAFAAAETALTELVDLPVDNEFSALLESFASGNAGTDADPYSSLGVDGGFNGMLNDDILLELNAGMPLGASISTPLGGGRALGGRIAGAGSGIEVGHGSSSTITLMHDDSGLNSQDDVAPPASASGANNGGLPPPSRPPPGMPGMSRGRSFIAAKQRCSVVPASEQNAAGCSVKQAGGVSPSAGTGVGLNLNLPSNPPSTSGLNDVDVQQMLSGAAVGQFLDWHGEGGEALEQELEGLINFDM